MKRRFTIFRFWFALACFAAFVFEAVYCIHRGQVPTFEQLSCFLVGVLLLVIAYKFLDDEKKGNAFFFAILGFVAAMMGTSAMQEIWKATVIKLVVDSARSYATKFNDLEETVLTVKSNVNEQQFRLEKHQGEIESAQATLRTNQLNIDSQQAKLEDVSNLLKGLYSRVVTEHFAFADTNRIRVWPRPTTTIALFSLSHVPVSNSVHGVLAANGTQTPLTDIHSVGNMCCTLFMGVPMGDAGITFEYINDITSTQITHRAFMDSNTSTIYLDGKAAFTLPP
jgi:hypothetical protein